jgi:replicative DNA helicase
MSRRSDDIGSLELLLDTICNTFGGVLFISILVIVLLNMTSTQASLEPPTKEAQAALNQTTRRLELNRGEIERLHRALEEYKKIEKLIDEPALREMLAQHEALSKKKETLQTLRDMNLEKLGKTQEEINKIAQDLSDLQKALRLAQEKHAQLKRALEVETAARMQTVELPQPRATTKIQVPIFLRDGRMTCLFKKDPQGGLTLNLDDCAQSQGPGGENFVEPKPSAGFVINTQGGTQDTLRRQLTAFDHEKHFLAIFVWPDSFPQFTELRNRIVADKFEYSLEILREGEKVHASTQQNSVIVF